MGTPFLHVRKSPLGRGLLGVILVLTLAFGCFGIWALIRSLRDPAMPIDLRKVAFAAPLIPPFVLLIGVSFSAALGKLHPFHFFGRIRRHRGVAAMLALPQISEERLLVVRIDGDEAGGGLIASQAAIWLLRRLWRATEMIYAYLIRGIKLRSWSFGVLVSVSIGVIAVETQASGSVAMGQAVIGVTAVVGVVLAIGYSLLLLNILAHLPFGLDAALCSFRVVTFAEATPTGCARVLHIQSEMAGLRHSEVYKSPLAVQRIASWISERVDASKQGVQQTMSSRSVE